MAEPLQIDDCSHVLDWIIQDQPPRKWLIDGYIPSQTIGFLQADGGVGKSNLSNLLALVIATGCARGPFIPSGPNRVLIINVEDSVADIALRINVLGNLYKIGAKEYNLIKKNLLVYPGAMSIGPLMCLENNKPVPTEHMKWLEDSIGNLKPALVILDTKSRLFGLEENSNTHNSIWLQQLTKIAQSHGCGFLIVHHNKKGSKDDKGSLSADAGRGGSSQGHDSRYVISGAGISYQEAKKYNLWPADDYFKIVTSKMNYGRKREIEFFRKMDEGVPVHVVPVNNKSLKIAEDLYAWLSKMEEAGVAITNRSLKRFDTPQTKAFKKEMELKHYGTAPRGVNGDVEMALNILVNDGKVVIGGSLDTKRGNVISVIRSEDNNDGF